MPREDVTIDHYAALELRSDATSEDIKKQFRKLALKYHPDRNPGQELEAKTKFQSIQAAHELLIDEVRRNKYDKSRRLFVSTSTYSTTTTHNGDRTATSRSSATSMRSGYASGAQPGESPFSSKAKWDQTSRAYGYSARKATQDRGQNRNQNSVPRTPKKTKENPYATFESTNTTHSSPQNDPKLRRERSTNEKSYTPLRSNFFADRNPREKEWMEDGPLKSAGTAGVRNNAYTEPRVSSEEELPKSSGFYAFTPSSRTRTNIHERSPERRNNAFTSPGENPKSAESSYPSEPPSPHRTNTFTRSHTVRESRNGEQLNTPYNDRRKSTSSAGADSGERRRFSYLFNEDGTRKPHKSSKQAEPDSDQDDFVESQPKTRGVNGWATFAKTPSNSNSRRNTLEREVGGNKINIDQKSNGSTPNGDRPKSYTHHATASDPAKIIFTRLNRREEIRNHNTETSNKYSNYTEPILEQSTKDDNKEFRPFSVDDWGGVFSEGTNPFAIPTPRKGQQSPRKMPAIPKLHTDFSSSSQPLNFSRPRPQSVPVFVDVQPELKDPGVAEATKTTHDVNASAFSFPQEEWQKAFSELDINPFDIKSKSTLANGPATRSGLRNRRPTSHKKSQNITSQINGLNINDESTSDPVVDSPHTENTKSEKTKEVNMDTRQSNFSKNTESASIPSPMAMDLDTPAASPLPSTNNGRFATQSKRTGLDHGKSKTYIPPTVSDDAPVSPIRGDTPPISPLRPGEVISDTESPTKKNKTSINRRSWSHQSAEKAILTDKGVSEDINLDSLKNSEPLSYNSSTGLNGHWESMKDNLPFESKAEGTFCVSPSFKTQANVSKFPPPPKAPAAPIDISKTSYDGYCAHMSVYQTEWNEYNRKIVNHLRARLDDDVTVCTTNNGYGRGFINGYKANIMADISNTDLALSKIREDQDIRESWDAAIKCHTIALSEWGHYLQRMKVHDEL